MIRRALFCMAVAAVSAGAPAAAQDYRPAPPQIFGEIVAGDESDDQGRRYDDHPVELIRGQRIIITAAPATGGRLTPRLELHPLVAGTPLAARDAEGGARTARLSFTAPYDGIFFIRVVSADPAAGGYTLSIRPAPLTNRLPVIGGTVTRPTPSDGPRGDGWGPRSRFIICPGHPRCPR